MHWSSAYSPMIVLLEVATRCLRFNVNSTMDMHSFGMTSFTCLTGESKKSSDMAFAEVFSNDVIQWTYSAAGAI